MALGFRAKVDTPKWVKMIREKQYPVAEAAVAALRDVAAMSVQEGRADIAAAGPNFRGNWQERLQYLTFDTKDETGGPSLKARAVIFHKYGIAGVFEYGATMHGRPLIWIPFIRGAPPINKSGKKLTFATVNGTPLAFDANDRDRHRKPLYHGAKQVTVPKTFHVTEIAKANWEKLGALFYAHLKDN
jgi:hypothetical protein